LFFTQRRIERVENLAHDFDSLVQGAKPPRYEGNSGSRALWYGIRAYTTGQVGGFAQRSLQLVQMNTLLWCGSNESIDLI
jgi:hypothetical protein